MAKMGMQSGISGFRGKTALITLIAVFAVITAGLVMVSDDDVSSGAEVTVGTIVYVTLIEPTETASGTAMVTGIDPTTTASVTIPSYFDDTSTTPAKRYNVVKIEDNAFKDLTTLTSVTIGGNVITIGDSAFSGCIGLTSVTIPSTVTSLGVSAFSGCTSLTTVTMSGGITSIGVSAFNACSALTTITLPDNVTSIGNTVFNGCSKLTSVTMPSVATLGTDSFKGCTALDKVTLTSKADSTSSTANSVMTYFEGTKGWILPGMSTTDVIGTLVIKTSYKISLEAVVGPNNSKISFDSVSKNTTGLKFYDINGSEITDRTKLAGFTFLYASEKWSVESFTITVKCVESTMGTITFSPEGAKVSDGVYKYASGTSLTLTASPNFGYALDKWDNESTSEVRTVTVTGDATYTATFMKVARIIVEVTPASWGSVSPGTDVYKVGDEVTFKATANTGFKFYKWEDDSVEPERKITIGDSCIIRAIFISDTGDSYNITITNSVNGKVAASLENPVKAGETVKITTTPDEGYEVESINIDGTTYYGITEYEFVNIQSPHLVSAVFVKTALALTDESVETIPTTVAADLGSSTNGIRYLIPTSEIKADSKIPYVNTGTKTLEFAVVNSDGSVLYSWSFGPGSTFTGDLNNLLMLISYSGSDDVRNAASKVSGNSSTCINFSASGTLPSNTTVKINVGGHTGELFDFYYYDPAAKMLDDLNESYLIKDGFATVHIGHCSDYVLISETGSSGSKALYYVAAILVFIIMIYVVLVVLQNLGYPLIDKIIRRS